MSAALVIAEPQQRSVLISMSDRYGMTPTAFEATVRATCMPSIKGGVIQATKEEFAAFLLVAKEYRLNPLTREIYAFPRKGGGIVPIVSVDGWVSLVNSHDACDGFEFTYDHDDKGKLVSCTCSIYRKDRGRPVVVTEYFAECVRETDPWRMQHRMLRHKALIQGARYAFGFSGIYDEDEGAIIAEAREISRSGPPPAPALPPAAPPKQIEQQIVEARDVVPASETKDAGASELGPRQDAPASDQSSDDFQDGEATDPEALMKEIVGHYETCTTQEVFDELQALYADDMDTLSRDQRQTVDDAVEAALARMKPLADEKPVDPFAIPEAFANADEYASWLTTAVAAATVDTVEALKNAWNDTKAHRNSFVLPKSRGDELREMVGKKLDELAPPEPSKSAPDPAQSGASTTPTQRADEASIVTTWEAYEENARAVLASKSGTEAWMWWEASAEARDGLDRPLVAFQALKREFVSARNAASAQG